MKKSVWIFFAVIAIVAITAYLQAHVGRSAEESQVARAGKSDFLPAGVNTFRKRGQILTVIHKTAPVIPDLMPEEPEEGWVPPPAAKEEIIPPDTQPGEFHRYAPIGTHPSVMWA